VVADVDNDDHAEIIVIQNWREELERRTQGN